MGIYDRDYYRNDTPAGARSMGAHLGQMRMWRVATWLIAINVAVFVIDLLLAGAGIGYAHLLATPDGGQTWREVFPLLSQVDQLPAGQDYFPVSHQAFQPLERWGYFSVTTAIGGLQVWRWITFQFLHAGAWHLLGNMIGLYFFGPIIEDFFGRKRFLAFYLLCGVAGPVVYLLFALTGILDTSPITPLIGASAGVFGILIAAAVVAPNATILIYGIFPMQLKTAALLLLGIAAYTVFTQGRNAGGEAAHLGGAALGYLLIRHPHFLNWAESGWIKSRLARRRSRQVGSSNMKYHNWR